MAEVRGGLKNARPEETFRGKDVENLKAVVSELSADEVVFNKVTKYTQ